MHQLFHINIDYEDRNTTFDRIYHIFTKRDINIDNLTIDKIESNQFHVFMRIHANPSNVSSLSKLLEKIPDVHKVEIVKQ
jgi:acetolactate synthase small subunit